MERKGQLANSSKHRCEICRRCIVSMNGTFHDDKDNENKQVKTQTAYVTNQQNSAAVFYGVSKNFLGPM